MSFKKFTVLKISCELEQILERIRCIQDMSNSFSGNPSELVGKLRNDYNEILKTFDKSTSAIGNISWKSNRDWSKKLKSMQR